MRGRMVQDASHVFLGFTHRHPADRIAVEADFPQASERFVAQLFIHPPLNDAEQRVAVAFMGALAALRPAQRQTHGSGGLTLLGGIRRALIEDHDHIGIQRALDAHRFLRRQETDVSVYRRAEPDPVLADLAQLAQAEHLETAGIGENRFVPGHEAMQSAVRRDDLQPGP